MAIGGILYWVLASSLVIHFGLGVYHIQVKKPKLLPLVWCAFVIHTLVKVLFNTY